MRVVAAALAAVLGLLPVVHPRSVAVAAQCASPAGVYREGTGWAQRLTDPARIWPLTDGSGQLVAVLGTGVDPANPQFGRDQVIGGSDLDDCDGRGTFAAGIVGAATDPATTFAGMAPGVRILALRHTQSVGSGQGEVDPDALANRIDRAVAAGASVILVVAPASRSTPALESAVRNALARDAVIVSPAASDKPESLSYPTALPGVIGVGAHDRSGTPVQAEAGPHILLAAPGADLVSLAAGTAGSLGHRWSITNPAFAAAYVAGTVVLIRAYHPNLTPSQVSDRLSRTANRPPSGTRHLRLGWGILDVQAAVTAQLTAPPPSTARTATPARISPAAAPAGPPTYPRLPGTLAIAGVAIAALSALTVSVTRRARTRNWRQG
ncbi:MAG TPA: S8 family serine peptidase [Actinophytocola sp.]|uniref:S8 family serine peptidase n=1 Tax=Actinophytocola sp. TaxID=1872138 RepID=UPI002DB838BA|nr:S8 family serine peptidase [Actinophytocola sp.]HEU5475328.1 S8 family serine peptidase [Actinophytocola sp.]